VIGAILSLLREWAIVAIGREIATRTLRRASEAALLFVLLTILSVAAVVFFYLFAYRWLSARLDGESAAAILCGANLLLIGIILGVRAISAALTRGEAKREASAELRGLMDIGLGLEERLREKAPTAALVAMIVGLAIGARPELLDIFKPSGKPKRPDR
jgi:hypothetical protein